MARQEIRFEVTQTGYDREPTKFLVTLKDQGIAPDIRVYQGGMYTGDLTLSQSGARELIRVLRLLIGDEFKQ